jgi:hypothetical protein
MNNNLLQIKIKQRLNKLASLDYDNIECWQIQEAFNKAQLQWMRRQLYGINIRKEGADQSSGLVDDLQRLMKHELLIMSNKDIYWQSSIPSDYLHYVRTDVFGKTECCDERRITVYQVEESNISIILDNKDKRPNFEWAETVSTVINNTLRVYTNNEFGITKCYLVYYRKPLDIKITGCIDISTGFTIQAADQQECEFNDDVAELIADEAAQILAGDIESMGQFQREQQNVQSNS